ncbi:MAG TPA: hypothetical protein VM533_03620 [Fimbriiglobus sp.]|jgi:hypothetical protein|nr:hypothetical protein [Fimbriiglobus sp.]
MPNEPSKADVPGHITANSRVKSISKILDKPSLTLADYHQIGATLGELSRDPKVAVHGSGWKEHVAKAVGTSPSTLNKSLQLAKLYKSGTLGELERTNAKWGLINIALTIKNADKRHKLLRNAVAHGWSDMDLRKHIQKQRGRLRGGGRKRRSFTSHGLQADAHTLVSQLTTIEKYYEQVWEPSQDGYRKEVSRPGEEARVEVAELLTQLGDQLDRVIELLGQVAGKVKDYRDRITVGESARSRPRTRTRRQ